MAIDPVCKMQVDPETASAKTEYRCQAYTLCCRDAIRALRGIP